MKVQPFPCRECGEPCSKRGGRCAKCGNAAGAQHRKPRTHRGPVTKWKHPGYVYRHLAR